jgi:hypothetical protein
MSPPPPLPETGVLRHLHRWLNRLLAFVKSIEVKPSATIAVARTQVGTVLTAPEQGDVTSVGGTAPAVVRWG